MSRRRRPNRPGGHQSSAVFSVFFALLHVIPTILASYCGRSGVPYSIEVLPSGAPVLGCAQPTCIAAPAAEDTVFQTDVHGQMDGFFREGDRRFTDYNPTNKHFSNCTGEFNELACTRRNQWVGGIEYIDHPRQPLILQCCTFDALRFSQDVGVTTVGPGEAVTGGEVIREGRQISFDVIANIRKVVDPKNAKSISYEVTVRRMNCLPDPPEMEVPLDTDVPAEVIRVLAHAGNGSELAAKRAAAAAAAAERASHEIGGFSIGGGGGRKPQQQTRLIADLRPQLPTLQSAPSPSQPPPILAPSNSAPPPSPAVVTDTAPTVFGAGGSYSSHEQILGELPIQQQSQQQPLPQQQALPIAPPVAPTAPALFAPLPTLATATTTQSPMPAFTLPTLPPFTLPTLPPPLIGGLFFPPPSPAGGGTAPQPLPFAPPAPGTAFGVPQLIASAGDTSSSANGGGAATLFGPAGALAPPRRNTRRRKRIRGPSPLNPLGIRPVVPTSAAAGLVPPAAAPVTFPGFPTFEQLQRQFAAAAAVPQPQPTLYQALPTFGSAPRVSSSADVDGSLPSQQQQQSEVEAAANAPLQLTQLYRPPPYASLGQTLHQFQQSGGGSFRQRHHRRSKMTATARAKKRRLLRLHRQRAAAVVRAKAAAMARVL